MYSTCCILPPVMIWLCVGYFVCGGGGRGALLLLVVVGCFCVCV